MDNLRPYIGYIVLAILALLLIALIPAIKSCAQQKAAELGKDLRGVR